MQERHLPRRPPRDAAAVEPESGQQALAAAFEVEEVDRRSAPFDAPRRPRPREEDRHPARLLPRALLVYPVALPELEGPDECGAAIDVRAERPHETDERRAAHLARL